MRVTVVRPSLVLVDNESIIGIDLAQLDPSIHAIQWYDTEGEIERVDERGRIIANEEITSFEPYQWIVDAWLSAKESMAPLPDLTTSEGQN